MQARMYPVAKQGHDITTSDLDAFLRSLEIEGFCGVSTGNGKLFLCAKISPDTSEYNELLTGYTLYIDSLTIQE